ncbi:MAG TPA: bacteriohopanetetrol glucosamine biosynthesis glycosyltransferase HpnI [Blastocatellia bacterium]|jgi:ceramide glucosyltransferase|nr:bacteriohopanetetrol glucosamine biosynthesis glycosyltransferase HpnI [Blastocatellia bacterium]
MKTFLLLCSLVVGSSLGEILSAKGMRKVGDVSFNPKALVRSLGRMIRSPYLFSGVACMAVAFFSFISLLSYADLSFVAPLTAVTYITNTLGARFFLKERISKERWLGTLLVALGVAVILLDKHIEVFFKTRVIEWAGLIYSQIEPGVMIDQAASPVAFRALFALRALLLACVMAAIIYYAITVVAGLLWFADRRRQRALGLNYTPQVTIFKPVRGADSGAYENFASFLRQDYPEYQIIFGLRDESDLAIPIIRRLIADFPERDIELVVSTDEFGHNAKVSNLQNMYAKAKHDVLLIADSDIRVEPDYLRRVVAPLRRRSSAPGLQAGAQEEKPQVGMVTCLYRGTNAKTFAGLLENIGVSATFGPDVCSARALQGVRFAFGSTIAMRRGTLERMGGFPALADYLADDFLLGNHAAKEGLEVVLSDCVVEHVSAPVTFAAMLRHQVRWARTVRVSRPWGYRGMIMTHGVAAALMAAAAWGFSGFAVWLLAVTTLARFLPLFVIGVYGLKDRALARYFWLAPIRDLIAFGVWMAGLVGDRVEWRGVRFRVTPGGKLVRSDT